MDILEGLNEAQRQAVTAGSGPVLIVAGPGTGKTKTLTARIAHLIESGQARPDEILALTFTKKAAEEMRTRIAGLLAAPFIPAARPPAAMPAISTFHALCHELLGGELEFVSEPERLQLIKQLPKPASSKGVSARELGLLISRAKNMAEDDAELARTVRAYDAALAERGKVDFDDLLVRVQGLLRADETQRAAVRARYRYILVDEFQDTNRLQYELLRLLRGHDNLFVIGDPNQSIYGFRGASGSIFDQFRADFPAHMAVALTANYRSVPEVVNLSNHVFAQAPVLEARGSAASGRVRAVEVLDEYSEAAWVLADIQRAIGGGDMLQAVSDDEAEAHCTLKDFAILYRNRSAAVAVQKAIADSGLPYQGWGEGSPYERPYVQALIALLRASSTGEMPVLEGYTAATATAVHAMLRQAQATPAVLAQRAIDLLGLEPTAALQQFVGTLVRFPSTVDAVRYFDTIAETNFYDATADAITLLTIHASKGLEFPYVFLVGAEEGILPHQNYAYLAGARPLVATDDGEEKRLFYVAITRAKDNLDILHAQKRGGQPAHPSRFITGLAADILPRIVDPNLAADQQRAQKRAIKRSQTSLF